MSYSYILYNNMNIFIYYIDAKRGLVIFCLFFRRPRSRSASTRAFGSGRSTASTLTSRSKWTTLTKSIGRWRTPWRSCRRSRSGSPSTGCTRDNAPPLFSAPLTLPANFCICVCSKIAREDQREWWMKVCWNNWTCKSYSLSKMKWIAYKSWLNKRLIYYSKLGCCVAHVYLMAGIIKHQNVYLNEFERET